MPTDALSSTETPGTGTPSTSVDVTATSVSTIGGKEFVIGLYNYLLAPSTVIHL